MGGNSIFKMKLEICHSRCKANWLRALENKTIQRVGGDKEIKIDLRLICATHQTIDIVYR